MRKKLNITLLFSLLCAVNVQVSANHDTVGGVGDLVFSTNLGAVEQVVANSPIKEESAWLENAVYKITVGGGVETDPAGNTSTVSAIPLPATVWLFGSAILGFIGYSARRRV